MTKQRIYAVNVDGPEPITRLVRAVSISAAIRHVAESMLDAKVASQDDLVSLLARGHKVEETSEAVMHITAQLTTAGVVEPSDESLRLVPRQAQA